MKFLLQNDKLSRNSPSERGVSLVHRLARVATRARRIFYFAKSCRTVSFEAPKYPYTEENGTPRGFFCILHVVRYDNKI